MKAVENMNEEENPHQRITDQSKLARLWELVHPFWHIGTTLLIGFAVVCFWIRDVESYAGTLAAHDARIAAVELKVNSVTALEAATNQRVNDIADFMGIPKIRKH